MTNDWFIYSLTDPRSNDVRYIGKTNHLRNRLSSHLSKAKGIKRENYLLHWLRELLSLNLTPAMQVLETGHGDGWGQAEQRWIRKYRDAGARLVNATDGGEGTVGLVIELRMTCKNCGQDFQARSIKSEYCDSCCTFDCINCDKTFYTRVYSRRSRRPLFCSLQCAGEGRLPSWRVCATCGRDFTTSNRKAHRCNKCRLLEASNDVCESQR